METEVRFMVYEMGRAYFVSYVFINIQHIQLHLEEHIAVMSIEKMWLFEQINDFVLIKSFKICFGQPVNLKVPFQWP